MKLGQLKCLLRSRSVPFFLDYVRPFAPGVLSSYTWRGTKVWYRPGSSDPGLIYSIMLKRGRKGEYAVPPAIRAALGPVETVLDVGTNIGISTLYLADLFPDARIFAFEPMPENYALLVRNTRHLPRVQVLPVALGERDGTIDLFASDSGTNFGGFSRFEAGSDTRRTLAVPLRHARRQLDDLDIPSASVIKIDVEGSEWEVLTALGIDFLRDTKLIMGELHGHRDFELLAFLSGAFHIEARKNLRARCFNFRALNRAL